MVLTLRKGPSGPPAIVSDTIVAPGELLGNPLGATTTEPAEPITGAEAGAIVRYAGFLGMAVAPGTYHNLAIPDGTNCVDIDPNPNGDVFITGFQFSGRGNAGAFFTLGKFNAGGRVILLPNNAGSNPGNRISTPGNIPYELPNASDSCYVQAIERDGADNVFQVCDRLTPASGVTQELSGFAVTITIAVEFPPGGGGAADDVIIMAVVPFQLRILDATLLIATAVPGSAVLRNQAGGGGPQLTSGLNTGVIGTVRNNDSASRTTSLGLFLRRTDSGAGGTLILTLSRV